jgi:hypothetical protein
VQKVLGVVVVVLRVKGTKETKEGGGERSDGI